MENIVMVHTHHIFNHPNISLKGNAPSTLKSINISSVILPRRAGLYLYANEVDL